MNVTSDQFTGPLFLVGMPRSGTKLLRDMLNQHGRIRFSAIETEFFPFWVAEWGRYRALESREGFEEFYRECLQLPFFVENRERGLEVDCAEWFRNCESSTPAAVFEALMRTVLSVSPQDNVTIWGDKSPSYIRHVPLLVQQFPRARIIHIVRDVRDCSLSANKAWGKNMLRAAQRWQDDVSTCREDARRNPSAFMQIRYEDLLAHPRATLAEICTFIGVEFDERMLSPSDETENKGDARGMRTLLTSNVSKYQSRMSPRTVHRIEMIACATLRSLGYPCSYTGEPVRLSPWKLRILQLADGWNLLRATMLERGLVGAFRFHRDHFRASGNRVR